MRGEKEEGEREALVKDRTRAFFLGDGREEKKEGEGPRERGVELEGRSRVGAGGGEEVVGKVGGDFVREGGE